MRTTKTPFLLTLLSFAVLFSLGYTSGRPTATIPMGTWYLLSIDNQPSGYLHVLRKSSPDASSDAKLDFEYEMLTNSQSQRVLVKMQTVCDDDAYLFPLSVTADIDERGQAPATLKATVDKEVPYGASKGTMRIIYRKSDKIYNLDRDIPEHTVSDAALLEIIPRLPFVEGTVFKFNFLQLNKLKVRKNHQIRYLGLDTITINNTTKSLHKFEQKGSGIKKMEYWLDDNHQLIRTLEDGKEELLLSTPADVKRLVKN